MYLGEYRINDYLDLVAVTHRFSSGAAYAATSITYRVYEDGSDVQIIADTAMTAFDAITGLYLDHIQLTAALGFETGKTYAILIQATVDSVAAIDWRTFKVINARDANITQVGGSATSLTDLKDFVDTGYDPTTHKVQGVVLTDTCTSVTNQVTADCTAISGVAATADRLEAWFNGFLTGSVVDAAPGVSSFITSSTEASDDHFNHMILVFTGGNLLGQARRISDYNGTTKMMYVQPPFTEAPANGDTWILVPLIVGGLDVNGRVDVGSWLGTAVTLTGGVPNVNVMSQDNIDFGALQKASLNAEVLDVLNTDTFAEPGQEAPAATTTLVKKIGYLYKFLRNKITQDATTLKIYADNGTTVDQKATVSDDATTYTRGEIGTGA